MTSCKLSAVILVKELHIQVPPSRKSQSRGGYAGVILGQIPLYGTENACQKLADTQKNDFVFHLTQK